MECCQLELRWPIRFPVQLVCSGEECNGVEDARVDAKAHGQTLKCMKSTDLHDDAS